MSARAALGAAVRDFYAQSWKLLALNAALGLAGAAVLYAAIVARPAAAAVVLLGPVAAALAHCAVKVVQTEDLELADALEGLRLHWRRGLALGLLGAVIVGAGGFAAWFYGGAHTTLWPLAFLALYVLFVLGVWQLLLWTLAIGEPQTTLREAGSRALDLLLRRPRAALGLGIALLVVNAAGLAAAVMPFLTLTLAYTFLAAAHFVFPREASR